MPYRHHAILVLLTAAWALAALPASAETTAATAAEQRARANAAYQAEEWSNCAWLYAEAGHSSGRRAANDFYNAACCAALSGDREQATVYLESSLTAGFRSPEAMQADQDLSSLHDLPAWSHAVAAAAKAEAAFAERVHPELYEMFEQDQAERHARPIDWEIVSRNDAERRRRAAAILDAGEAEQAEDFYHAAMIFQHGSDTADFDRAHQLASRAVELESEYTEAKWLYAAAYDRWLHSQDKPQIYGTQFRKPPGSDLWTLEPLDADAVTDEERAAHGVPPLAEARRRVERMNGSSP